MKYLYIFLLFIAGLVGFGQTTTAGFCHSDEVLQNLKNSDPSLQERMNRMDEDIRNYGNNYKASPANRPAQTSFTIPVIVYVVHNNQPLGTGSNIRDEQVQAQLAALNTYFVGSGLSFCLATKAGSQTLLQAGVNNATATSTTAGIVHVNNAPIATHLTASSSQQALISGTSGYSLTQDKFLRIWIVDSIDGSATSGIQGYSYLPNTSSTLDGIVMNYRVFGNIANTTCNCPLTANYQQGKILAHEVGHYLGLRHTFEGGCHDTSGFNNQILGDRVIDTPPIQEANLGCPTTVDSCTSDNLPDDISNYMDYTYDACKNHFTTGQLERMLFQLLNYRSGLYDTDNLIFTGVCGSANLISSTFTGSLSNTDNSYIYNICSGSTMYFKPVTPSVSYPVGSLITYLWDFGNGLTSTSQNPSIVYSQSATTFFNVTLTVTYNGNSSISTKNIYVNNCAPIVNNESTWYYSGKNILNFATGVPRTKGIIDFPGQGFFPGIDNEDNSFNSVAIQNDANGNVLFFTDGKDIFNGSNPAVKINNTMLIGNGNFPQSIIILKSRTYNNQYYIINSMTETTFFPISYAGIRYTIVNVNNGVLTIPLNSINIPIIPSSTQTGFTTSDFDGSFSNGKCIQAIEKIDGGYWIITPLIKTDGKTYLGIFDFSLNGSINLKNTFLLPSDFWLPDFPNYTLIGNSNKISISPSGNKIIYLFDSRNPLILDFDKYEGIISQTTSFEHIPEDYSDTFIFSPDSKLLYSRFGQMDLNNATVKKNPFSQNINFGMSSIYGTDGKIYHLSNINRSVNVIHKPNIKVTNFNANAFQNQENFIKPEFNFNGNKFLPNFIQSKKATAYNVNQISAYKVGCGRYKFFPDVPVNSATPVFSWNFGDPNSGTTNNISSLNTPIHVFSGSGTYTVSLTYNGSTTITTQIVITTFTAPAIQGTSSVCFNGGNATTFNSVALLDGQTVVWTRTSGNGIILQNNQSEVQINWTQLPGTITATITDSAGCVGTVTKTITSSPNIIPTFNVFPASICTGGTVPVLPTTSTNSITGVWSPSVINNTTTGSYVFYPNVNNCASPVTVSITILPETDLLCSNTNDNCSLSNLTLSVSEPNATVLYRRQNSIITNNNYVVTTGKNVTMRAGDLISLKPNTYINSGAVFSAKIETCYEIIVESRPIQLSFNNESYQILKKLTLFPNPNIGNFQLYNIQTEKFGNQEIELNIYDLNGRNLHNQKFSKQDLENYQFSLLNLQNGIYIVRLSNSTYYEDLKFIKN